jgi:tetratricopeptide (TPR) repeat protein
MRTTGFLVLTGLVLVSPQVASAQQRIERVVKNMPTRYIEPTCDLKYGHFQVSSVATYLKSGTEAGDPVKTESILENAINTATKAIVEFDQGDNGAAWYLLGRTYLQLGNIVGADSAFTKASALIPECAEDIKSWRQRAWLPLMTPATEFVREGHADSAMTLFRLASVISRAMPQGFYNMGVLFANNGQTDSAIVYFQRAQELAASDAKQFRRDRSAATFNLAAMLQRNNEHERAVVELRQYVEWEPDDVDAKRALATSLRAIGKPEEAAAIDREVLAAAQASGDLSTGDMMSLGINLFNDKKFAEAADAFRQVLVKEPWSRDALYNLANAYYALDDGAMLVETATRLVEQDPLSEEVRKLLAQGYRITADTTRLIEVVTELLAMPTTVTVQRFNGTATGAVLGGIATGKQAERDGSEVAPAPRTLVVEFVNGEGTVVTSAEVAVPALQPAVEFEWKAEGEGQGIVGWRYTAR